ncbi:MAG: hypothetical protein GWO24_38000, partial [Akkermansiaceae bacterium]|nr:hypothetical protein [Akkermansiaceae bacterium]
SYNDVIRRNNQLDRLKIETRRAAGSANPRARMVKKLQEVKEEAHGGRRRGKRLKGRAGNPFVGEKLPTVPRYGGRVGMLRMQEARVRPPRPHSVELPGDIPVAWAVGGRVHEMSAATRRYTKGRVVVWAPIEEVFEATERWQWINLNDPLPARVWQAKWYWSTGRAMDPPQIGIAEASGQVL